MIRYENGEFKISVRQLVEFIFKSGDLDNRKGVRRELAMADGIRIHKKLQKEMGPDYTPEVSVRLIVPVSISGAGEPDFNINIEGRADGIFKIPDEDAIGIDEIKGMYADVQSFETPIYVHQAQAMCYGYIKTLEDKRAAWIQLTYVDLDTELIKRFKMVYKHEELKDWFDRLIDEYKKWCIFYYIHRQEFIKTAGACEFPYPYRRGQRNIVVSAYRALKQRRNLYIQASTGIGKTLSTLFPAIRIMGEERAERIFYLTAKTITRTVASQSMDILIGKGLKASYLLITAKEKLCVLEETDCNPAKCERAKGHLDRVNAACFELITTKNAITREDIEEAAQKHKVCPFELCLDVSYYVDVIICDYNYVFDPNVRLARFFQDGVQTGSIFLIDEAHNLVDRAREMVSAVIVKEDFVKARKLIREVSRSTANRIEKCNRALLSLKRECDGFHEYRDISELGTISLEIDRLYNEFAHFQERYPGYYNKEFSDFFFSVRDFYMCLERFDASYRAYTTFDEEGRFILKLMCADPSSHISNSILMGVGTIFFSATMFPITYYKRLLGGDEEDYAIYAESPFDTSKRLLLVGNDVSTKYTRRVDSEYERIGDYIKKVTSKRSGNYLVFFPSYAFLSRMEEELTDIKGELLIQSSHMSEADREEFLTAFSDTEDKDKLKIGLCVMGGIFSEGIDLKGESLIGVIVVGTGLLQVSEERNLLKRFFDEGGLDGFAYSYTYPGMNRVLQSAGRLIRTEDDYGVILLLDERFLRRDIRALFPREWSDMRLTNVADVAEQVCDFWNKNTNSLPFKSEDDKL